MSPSFSSRLRENIQEWRKFASQDLIIWVQEGVHIPFSQPPTPLPPAKPQIEQKESSFVDSEILKLLDM